MGGHPLPEEILKFSYDVFQANSPKFMSASNHQESHECECDFFKKLLFIYKTKVPTSR